MKRHLSHMTREDQSRAREESSALYSVLADLWRETLPGQFLHGSVAVELTLRIGLYISGQIKV